jgi:hypothetical protein
LLLLLVIPAARDDFCPPPTPTPLHPPHCRCRADEGIDFINSRNAHFNKKLERAFGSYTKETKVRPDYWARQGLARQLRGGPVHSPGSRRALRSPPPRLWCLVRLCSRLG